MTIDLTRASAFMTTHARLLDRRRFDLIGGRPGGVPAALTALAAYRNADGGYGWALEPDLRAPGSQPVAALHAFEVFEEIGPATSPDAALLCDWLASVTLPDGGLPFARSVSDTTGSAPFWGDADPSRSSLHMTTVVAGIAHRVARHDATVRDHAWLARATHYCRREIAGLSGPRGALEFRYVLEFLDAASDTDPGAATELERLGGSLPPSATMPVEGGAESEAMRPLDISPQPGRPLRRLVAAGAIAEDLDRLAARQQDDGGWTVDWASWSPAGALEWRGWATVRAVRILLAHRQS